MSVRSSIAVLAVLAVVALLVFGLLSKGSSGVGPGDVAPAPTLQRLEGGGTGSLAQYRGRWVLVNFWSSWCVPCRQESPTLNEFEEKHGDKDFTVLGIDYRDLSGDGRAFLRSYGIHYPQLRDSDGEAAHEYGTSGVPENFLVDPKGIVRLHIIGPVTARSLRESVAPLLPGGGKS